jgi:biopolymer transport protein ExbB
MIDRILNIWADGGWVMWPLLGVSLLLFIVGLQLWLDLARRQHRRLADFDWQMWVRRPERADGEVGEVIRYTQGGRTAEEISQRFAEVSAAELPAIDRRLSTLGALVASAPLVGLLGTVFGMLVTFQALAAGGGGKVTEAMADGISQALFPPEVGLCIALPGLVLIHLIRRQRQELEAFLTRLESYSIQHFRKTLPPPDRTPKPESSAKAEPVGLLRPMRLPA